MTIDILMPDLGAESNEADLVEWLVKAGDQVEAGDLIAEIETDKATVEFESPETGVIVELCIAAGTCGVRTGDRLARIETSTAAEPVAEPAVEEVTEEAAPAPATALARRVAEQAGVDLRMLEGSGAGGRILRADVDARLPDTSAAEPMPEPAAKGDVAATRIPHTKMRRTIASRLSAAKREIPHFYLDVDCEIDEMLAMRKRFKQGPDAPSISVNDFVIAAAARALREVPEANASWSDDVMVRHETVDIAVAVATDGGLVTPILRDADRKGLREISREMRDLAERARSGSLRPDEYRGGSLSISNLGMFGVRRVYAIVNPPHACIIGVGQGEARPVVRGGEITVATLMTCTLSADHRVVDGATGARLLSAVKRLIEHPLEIML